MLRYYGTVSFLLMIVTQELKPYEETKAGEEEKARIDREARELREAQEKKRNAPPVKRRRMVSACCLSNRLVSLETSP